MEKRGVHLIAARKFRAHKPGRAGTNMTFCAGDTGVRRVLVGGEFRLHHCVASLPAKLFRLGEMVAPVAADRNDQQQHDTESDETAEDLPVPGTIQIHHREPTHHALLAANQLMPFKQHPAHDDEQTESEECWCDEVRDDADVRILRGGKEIHRHQTQHGK